MELGARRIATETAEPRDTVAFRFHDVYVPVGDTEVRLHLGSHPG